MQVKSASFIKSYADGTSVEVQADMPLVCVAGRSNCGKSSLLNLVMGARLCKTSSSPGRTRLINLFGVNCEIPFCFVDLPGYGYHKAQKSLAAEWSKRTDDFFRNCKQIAQVLCLMDIRRDPSDLDKTLINYLRDLMLPFTVVATKADKLSRAQSASRVMAIAAALGLARDNIIVTSASSGQGKTALLDRLGEVLAAYTQD